MSTSKPEQFADSKDAPESDLDGLISTPKGGLSADTTVAGAEPGRNDPLAFCDWLREQEGVLSVPVDQPFYPAAARALRESFPDCWPDCTRIQILVPHGDARRALTQALSDNESPGQTTFFGLNIAVLRPWVLAQLPPESARYCSEEEALLALALRIKEHGGVRFNQNHWQFSPALIDLFNCLEQNRIDEDALEHAVTQKRRSWRLDRDNYLAIEAKIVQLIWRAWRRDLKAGGYTTGTQAYNRALEEFVRFEQGRRYWILVPDEPIPAEQNFLRTCLSYPDCRMLVCDRRRSPAHPDFAASDQDETSTARHRWLYHCLFDKTPIKRAHPKPGKLHYRLLRCANEARQTDAVIEAVTEARQRKQRVAIVAHNRRFARALRATMDGASLQLHDRTGWALSTTFSGSALKIWLNVIDRDYASDDVFNYLRTTMPIFGPSADTFFRAFDELRSGFANHFRANFKPGESMGEIVVRQPAPDWIRKIHRAGAPLTAQKNNTRTLAQWFTLLEQSLHASGLWDFLAADEDGSGAGCLVVERIRRFQRPALLHQEQMEWEDFLAFIDHQLEHNRYAPPVTGANPDADLIQMGNILPQYDLLIFAAMEQNNFPGRFRSDLLFNDEIYLQLGLQPPQQERERRMLARFTEALLASSEIVFAYSAGDDETLPCPWLSQIIDLCEQDGIDLSAHTLLDSAEHKWRSRLNLSAQKPARPRVAHRGMVQADLSVSDYQGLIDCPYSYFFQSRLKIRRPRKISQIMRADIYGQLAHRCMKELNEHISENEALPLESAQLDKLRKASKRLVERIFSDWMRDSLVNMTHVLRLQKTLDEYCQWLCAQQVDEICAIEKPFELSLESPEGGGAIKIKGRTDFILKGYPSENIVDFKTNPSPYSIKAICSGRDIQLLTYALAYPSASDVCYLGPASSGDFQKPLALKSTGVSGEELKELRQRNRERLERLAGSLHRAHLLQAYPDDKKCAACPFETVCRPREWAHLMG